MLESLIQECLELIQSGATIEEALARYPAQADDLRPLLKAAVLAQEVGKDRQIPAAAQSRSLSKFLSAARAAKAASPRKISSFGLRLAFSLALLLVIILIATGSVVAVSAHALPGQPLYPIKLVAENTRLMLTKDPKQRLTLEQSFDQERAAEVHQLISLSRSIPVNFSGSISKIDPGSLTVSGLHIIPPSGTNLASGIGVGVQVTIKGQIQPDGVINASEIQPKNFQFTGTVEKTDEPGWVVDGIPVKINSNTSIQGEPAVGSRVWVSGVLMADGSIQSLQIQSSENPPVETKEDTTQPSSTVQPSSTIQPSPTSQVGDSETPESGNSNTPQPEDTKQPPALTNPDSTPTPANVAPSPTQVENDDGNHPSATPVQPGNNVTPAPTHED